MGLTPELRKAIEEKAEAAANANTRGITKHALIRHVFAAGAEACFEIMQVDRWAFENLTRKLNEANTRIVEFDGIKAGHLKVQAEMQAEIERLRDAIEKARAESSWPLVKGILDAAIKDPGGV